MKSLRPLLFVLAIVIALANVIAHPSLAACAMSAIFIWLTGNALGTPRARLCVTLSTTEILADTMDAFKASLPMIDAFSTNFSSERARLNDQVIVHLAGLPAIQSYDASTGYKANAAEADSLITDVTVTLNQHKHVPVKVDYLTQLASRKNLYAEAIRNQGFVLAKSIVDYVLGLVIDTSVTQETVSSTGNQSYDTLETIRTALNNKKAAPLGRFGLVNSASAQALAVDTRIASRDYYGQVQGTGGYRKFTNVAGFENIWEYPDLPDNSINLAGFFGDRRAAAVATRLPNVQDAAALLGLPNIASFDTVTDPDTGLSLLGIGWQEAGTFDVYLTVALIYGASVGAATGGAGVKVDYAAHKLVTS